MSHTQILKQKTRDVGRVSKAAFKLLTKPQPGPHHPFMASLGFSLRQTISGVQVYSYTGSKEKQTPVGRSVTTVCPLWITLTGEDTMVVQVTGTKDRTERFDEARIVELVRNVQRQKPELKFPALPPEYQEDDQIFASGIDWQESEQYQDDVESIPFNGEPMHPDDEPGASY